MSDAKQIDNRDIIALIVIILGAVLRFYNYAGWSLSNDELSAMFRLQFPSFAEMIEKGVKLNDMHPAGVQSFLWFWTHLFGTSEYVYRFPFVVFSVLSIWILYLITSRWFNKTAALFTIALFSALEFPILYSQLARPYSPGLFFILLFVYAFTNIVFPLKKKAFVSIRHYFLFVFAGAGCMYTHYFSFMLAGIVGITGISLIEKKKE